MSSRVKNFFIHISNTVTTIALASGFILFPPLLSKLNAQEDAVARSRDVAESSEVVKNYFPAQVKAGLMYKTYLGLSKYQKTEFFDEYLKPIMEIGAKFEPFNKEIASDGKMVFLPEKADEASDSVNTNWGKFLAYLEKVGYDNAENVDTRVTLYAYYGPDWDKRKTSVDVSYVRFIYVDYPDLYAFLKGIVNEVKGLKNQGIEFSEDFSTWGIDESKVVPADKRAPFSESFVMRYSHLKKFFELLKPYSQCHISKIPTESIPYEIFSHFSLHSQTIDAVFEEDFAKSEVEAKYDVYGNGYSNKKAVEDRLRTPLLLDQISWLNKYLNGYYVISEETTKVVTDHNTGEQKKTVVPRNQMQRFQILKMADPKLARMAKLVLEDYGYKIEQEK